MRAQDGASEDVRRTSRTTKTAAAATCETTFAIAEPSMPSPKPRISASESATLARLEATSTTRPVRVSWNARSQPCAAAITSMNGAPSAAMRNHVSASCSAALSSEPAISRRAGPATISSATGAGCPSASASQVACTPTSSASSRCPAPYRRAALAVVPYSRNVQRPTISESSVPAIARPASGTRPRCPTIAVSPST